MYTVRQSVIRVEINPHPSRFKYQFQSQAHNARARDKTIGLIAYSGTSLPSSMSPFCAKLLVWLDLPTCCSSSRV